MYVSFVNDYMFTSSIANTSNIECNELSMREVCSTTSAIGSISDVTLSRIDSSEMPYCVLTEAFSDKVCHELHHQRTLTIKLGITRTCCS